MLPLQKWSILLLACILSLAGCKQGPRVSFCVLDAANSMLRCSDPDKQAFDLSLAQADNYGCMSPEDWERLLKAGVEVSVVARAAEKEFQARIEAHPVMKEKWKKFSKPRRADHAG